MNPNIAVIGAGAIGAATALALTKMGANVTVFDRFKPPHNFGAHGGESRLLRSLPYLEPTKGEASLLGPSIEMWDRIEQASGEELITRCGGVIIDNANSPLVKQALKAGGELLDSVQAVERFPQLHLREHEVAIFDPQGGIIDPAAAVEAMINLASQAGAQFRFNEPVTSLTRNKGDIRIKTSKEEKTFDKVVIAAGSYSNDVKIVPTFSRRLLLGWFSPRPGQENLLMDCPSFVWAPSNGQFLYGGPSYDGATLKIGIDFDWGTAADPADEEKRIVTANDRAPMQEVVNNLFPWLDPVGDRFEMHIDSWTKDKRGLLGEYLERPGVILATGWSGYGFKLAPELGEAAAKIALGQQPKVDLSALSPERFNLETNH